MNSKTKKLTVIAIMTALMCILGPMSVPFGQIPITLTNLVVYLAIILLGAKLGTTSYIVYLFIGAIGMPVFSGFSGGLTKIVGPTGGYLVGFVFMAIISGLFYEKSNGNFILTLIGMIIGTAVDYFFGTIWFVYSMKANVFYALTVCVFPFIIFDIIKMVLAIILGKVLKTSLIKSGIFK